MLLAKKKLKIGAGCWNGYGGGLNPGERYLDAAVRELFEECGVKALPENLTKIAIMDFRNTKSDGTTFVIRVHFYTVSIWTGEPQETNEMSVPQLFSLDELPLDEMMPADRAFLSIALNGKKIIGSAHYGPFQKEMQGEVRFCEINEFPNE